MLSLAGFEIKSGGLGGQYLSEEDEASARASQRLVRSCRYHITKLERTRCFFGRHQSRDVRHVAVAPVAVTESGVAARCQGCVS